MHQICILNLNKGRPCSDSQITAGFFVSHFSVLPSLHCCFFFWHKLQMWKCCYLTGKEKCWMCGTCCASRICHLLFSKPHLLEYDAVVWNLHKLGDITKLEVIQKAIHFVYWQFDRDSPSPFISLVFVPFKAKLHASDFLVTATSDRF